MSVGVNAARWLTQSPGRTALLGAGVGAAARGATAEEGQRGNAMFTGALQGAAVGGAVGGAGRMFRDTKLIAKDKGKDLTNMQAAGATLGRMAKGVKRFGQRQLYGTTGIGDPNRIGMAGTEAAKRQNRLTSLRMGDEIAHAPGNREEIVRQGLATQTANTAHGVRAQALQDAGVTSFPGMAKALVSKDRRGAAFRAMGRTLKDGPGGLAMGVAAPLAFSAPSLLRGDESATGGPTLGHKLTRAGGNLATGVAFGGLPIIPQIAAGVGTDLGIDRAFKRKQSPQQDALAWNPPFRGASK
jgi:hypothetical protein